MDLTTTTFFVMLKREFKLMLHNDKINLILLIYSSFINSNYKEHHFFLLFFDLLSPIRKSYP